MIDTLCQRYHCLPSQLLKEDAHELLQMLSILGLGQRAETQNYESLDPTFMQLGNQAVTLGE